MIVVDTSALMAIALDEAEAGACMLALQSEATPMISAGTVAEALVVAARRNVGREIAHLIDGFGFEIVPVTFESARRVAQAYERWGKGIHAASLNIGDCFAYELARDRACPLLFVGSDFAKTDIERAL